MEVEKVCKACIAPSSPTPSHLKTYNISILDQVMPPTYTPIILFYSNQESTIFSDDFISKRSLLLKLSLSETLSRFYPLAGKLKDNLSIDCNDEGVYYEEARANISLSEYLKNPDLSSTKKLLPSDTIAFLQTPESYLAMIQESTFTCGGFTIGVLVSHIISDGIGLSSFLKAWAATSCKSNKEILHLYPYLQSPSIFPQYDSFLREEASLLALYGPFFKKMKINTRRFVFDASAIANLKDKAIRSGVKYPTRVEVITALLTKCLMDIFNARSGFQKPLAINHSVNLRPRAEPPLPECSLGNFIWLASALCKPKEEIFSGLVCQLREAIGEINGDFVKKLKGDGAYLKLCEMIRETSGMFGSPSGVEYVAFTSWCNFGLYDIDFGWGKPVWTSCVGAGNNSEIVFVNSIVLMDARKEKGIEAWLYLDEEDMLLLEKDKELLQYACVDPTP